MNLYRGRVHAIAADGRPVVVVPRVLGSKPFGPVDALETGRPVVQPDGTVLQPGLLAGDAVIVADGVDGYSDRFVVLGKLA